MSPKAIVRAVLTRAGPLATILVAFVLAFCGIATVMLAQLREEAWNSASRGAENLLAAVSQDVSRNVEVFDLSLQAVIDGLKLPGVDAMDPALRQALLFDRAATARYLGAILVLDESGAVVEDAGAVPPRQGNFSDREYFRALRDTPHQGLFISRPFRRRLTGQDDQVIALARRVSRADGSFGGVVVGTVRLDYFQDLFARFSLGRDGAVVLFGGDGTVLMRMPFDEALIGRDASAGGTYQASLQQASGTWNGVTLLDGVERVVFYSHIQDLPLVLTVALSPRDIYAAWNARASVIALLLLALCAATTVLFVLLGRELKRRGRAEAELRRSEEQYRLLADHATDVIIRNGPGMVRRYVSPSCLPVLGYTAAELTGRPARAIVHPDDWPELLRCTEGAIQDRRWFTVEHRIRHKAGHWVWVEGRCNCPPGQDGVLTVLRDITARKRAEEQLARAHAELTRLASTDGLTGLANRRQLDVALEREWRRAARERQPVSLLLLDIDLFKPFNDRYGHGAGDACLRRVADAVAAHARRPADLAARYGGEELVLLLPGLEMAQAALVGERVREAIADLRVEHAANAAHGSVVTASIGVATAFPQPGTVPGNAMTCPVDLVEAADQALYRAKRAGRNQVATPEAVRPGTGDAILPFAVLSGGGLA